jgi:hypothetical protein
MITPSKYKHVGKIENEMIENLHTNYPKTLPHAQTNSQPFQRINVLIPSIPKRYVFDIETFFVPVPQGYLVKMRGVVSFGCDVEFGKVVVEGR